MGTASGAFHVFFPERAGPARRNTNLTGAEMAKLTSNTSGNFKTYGIKTADYGRSHTGVYSVIAVLVLVFVCVVAVWGIKRHIKARNNVTVEDVTPRDDNAVPASSFRTQPGGVREYHPAELDPSDAAASREEYDLQRLKQQRKLYDKAVQAYNEHKYENCRTILRDLLGGMDSSEQLYDTAANLLGRASMSIYRSGSDSETNVAYTVKSGDNLSRIAANYNTSVAAIKKVNNLLSDRLNIGQQLKIPQSVWSIVIRRSDDRLILYTNKKVFKIYRVYPGSYVSQSFSGTFRIFSKEKDPEWRDENGQTFKPGTPGNIAGSRWMALKGTGASANSEGAAIHGNNRSGTPDTSAGAPGYFRLSNADAIELFDLVPTETLVEIKAAR